MSASIIEFPNERERIKRAILPVLAKTCNTEASSFPDMIDDLAKTLEKIERRIRREKAQQK